ncbi:hypothetical protein [Schlesneria paludicola]|uniref:hypothetical protein n=1 Tax=Schlesneria paludicola TaxID=360056 RepID=UPI00029ADFED|nr:hypothetical protein [Schlesneria paludicola]
MDDGPTTVRSTMTYPLSSSQFIWLMVSSLATTALTLVSAHAPPRIRLIGLFSIAFGALVGWAIVQLAIRFDAMLPRRIVGLTAVVLTIAGLIGCMIETYRQTRWPDSPKGQMSAQLHDLGLKMVEEMNRQIKPSDTASQVDLYATMSFRRFLARRLAQLGEWSSPWPELFWAAEIGLAAVTSFWVATRSMLNTPSVPEPSSTTQP